MFGRKNFPPSVKLLSATSGVLPIYRNDIDTNFPFSHAAVALGKQLFPLFALALDLHEDFFSDKVRPVHRRCMLY
jgi:isopenicillin N synthase-like dioxygenase